MAYMPKIFSPIVEPSRGFGGWLIQTPSSDVSYNGIFGLAEETHSNTNRRVQRANIIRSHQRAREERRGPLLTPTFFNRRGGKAWGGPFLPKPPLPSTFLYCL